MDLGSEISHNFKISIKKKLKESGTYIDDELPEYIMVMIANKRNEYQMKEDLSLFLGEETEQFVTWLFVMLRRLQNAAKVEGTNSETKLVENAEPGLSKTDQTERQPVESMIENEAETTELEDKESALLTINENDGQTESFGTLGSSKKEGNQIKREEKDLNISQKGNDKHNDSKEYCDKNISKTHERKLKRRHRSRSTSLSRKQEGSDDDRQMSNDQKESSRQRTKSWESSKRQRIRSNEEQNETDEKLKTVASQVTVQKVRPSLPTSRQASGLLIKRAIQEANSSVAVPRVRSEDKTETEASNESFNISIELKNDRRRSHLKRDKKLEDNARPTLTTDVQEEATKDDHSEDVNEVGGKRLRLGDIEKSQDDGIEVEVPENEFLDEESVSKKRADKRIVIAHGSVHGETNEEDKTEDKRDLLPVQCENSEDKEQIKDGEEYEKINFVEDSEDKPRRERRKHRHRREKSSHSHRERRHNSPKFVVTLHGALDEMSKRTNHRRRRARRDCLSGDEDSLFIDMHPKAPMEILESAQQEIDKMAHRLDMMQNLLPVSGIEQYSLPPASSSLTIPALNPAIASIPKMPLIPGNALSDQFNAGSIRANAFLPQQALTRVVPLSTPVIVMQNIPDRKKSSTPKSKLREVVVPLRGENDNEFSDSESVEPVEEEETEGTVERCKFWPSCKNSSCQYIHPSKTCRTFPNCNFKEKCIFLHPVCRFDNRCTKPACPYTHTKKQRSKASNIFHNGTSLDISIPLCRFYPNCSKSKCPFRHPPSKACRYGSGCKRNDCPFHHETRPATGDALKWSLNSKQSPQHPSDRIFAASPQEVTSVPVKVSTLQST